MPDLKLQPLVGVPISATATPAKDLPVPGGQTIGEAEAPMIASVQPIAQLAAAPAVATERSATRTTSAPSSSKGGGAGLIAVGILGAVGLAFVISRSGGRLV